MTEKLSPELEAELIKTLRHQRQGGPIVGAILIAVALVGLIIAFAAFDKAQQEFQTQLARSTALYTAR